MIEVRAPCRLHFGLLAYGHDGERQFGGAGLMVRRPDALIRLTPATASCEFTGSGRMSDRAVHFARHFAHHAIAEGLADRVPGAHFEVVRVPRPHIGLGSGTQIAMAVATAMGRLIEREDLPMPMLARWVGRGRRSAIGVHGCRRGGLIVEGGKKDPHQISPMVARFDFPDWPLVLVRLSRLLGLAGQREQRAFEKLPPIRSDLTDRMARLVLLGLLPALIERDLAEFGQCLFELQHLAGECFKSAQGGVYADPQLEEIVQFIRRQQVHGVGQSSWGPTLYAVTSDIDRAQFLAEQVQSEFKLDPAEVTITRSDNEGAVVRTRLSAAGSRS